jgi:hypothetical protein
MEELLRQFKSALSTGGDFGMLITADAMQEIDHPDCQRMAELLRSYVDIQTCVRMSQVPPSALAKRYDELNKSFGTKPELRITGGRYHKPFGYYYTALEINQENLLNDLDRLSEQPVRELVINNVTTSGIAVILRNYRMESMFTVRLNCWYRHLANPNVAQSFAEAIKEMKALQLMRLTVAGINDTKKLLQLYFQMAHIRKDAELWHSYSSYDDPRHIATKRTAPMNRC